MSKISLVIPAMLLALSGCTAKIAGEGGVPKHLAAYESQVYYANQATTGPCLEPAESAILATVASAMVAEGVNRIGSAINAAAKEETKTVLSRRNVEFSEGASIGACITIARGWFYRNKPLNPRDGSYTVPYLPHRGPGGILDAPDQVRANLWASGLYLATTPDFYFQGQVATSTDGKVYTVLPRRAYLGQPISSSSLRRSSERHVLVSIALSKVGGVQDLAKGGGTTIVLGKMKKGELVEFPLNGQNCLGLSHDGTGSEFSGSRIPLNCDDASQRGGFDILIRSPFESEWFTLPAGEQGGASSLQTLVSETRSASEFLSFVSAVFDATKGDLTTELQEGLISSVGAAADEKELQEKVKAQNAADEAFGKAYTALAACVAAPSDGAKRAAARSALRTYLQAARIADRRTQLGSGDIDAITLTGTSATQCSNAQTKLATSASPN